MRRLHARPRQSGSIGEHRRGEHTCTHAVFLSALVIADTHGRCAQKPHSAALEGKKNRRAQPMFVMAVRATFPIFNSGTCSDAKNLLPCHSLPGEERERRRGSEGEGNLWLSV